MWGKEISAEEAVIEEIERLLEQNTGIEVTVRLENGEFIATDSAGQEFPTGIVKVSVH
jgi:hypothetical protein